MNQDAPGSDATRALLVGLFAWIVLWGLPWMVGEVAPHAEAAMGSEAQGGNVSLKLNVITGWVYTPDEPLTVHVISTVGASRDEVLAPVYVVYPQFHVTDIERLDVVGSAYLLPSGGP